MSDLVVEFLNTVNIIQLIAIGVMIWFFYNRLDTKIEKLDVKIEKLDVKIEKSEEKLKAEMKRLESDIKSEIDKLGNKVEDVDRRLCRIEGSLSAHGHCLFSQAQPEKKAE